MPHLHEKIDFVSSVYIVNGDAVLLRKHDKYKMWLPPGGHIELDEDPSEAATREVKEEVGLDITLSGITSLTLQSDAADPSRDGRDIVVPYFINRHQVNETHEHISFEYFATANSRVVTQEEKELSDDIQWFTKDMLENPEYDIPKRVVRYAKKALEVLGT